MRYLAGLVVGLSPILTVAGLLALAAWRDRRRVAVVARQIRLTDAIAAEMGAVVAPVVEKRLWGPWRVRMTVPAGRPALLGRILWITQTTLSRMAGGPWEVVLTTEPTAGRLLRVIAPGAERRAA